MTLYVNGRFLTQPVSGVQRYAREILTALDAAMANSPALCALLGPVDILVPASKDRVTHASIPDWTSLRVRAVPGGRGHLWEQGALLRASRDGVLLSLGNSGPLLHQRHVLTLHDAHIYQIPEAFSFSYRTAHRVLRPRLAQQAAALITVSRYSANALAKHLDIDPARFDVVHNAAEHILHLPSDNGAPGRYGLRKGGYILSVGNQSPNKNLVALVSAHAATPVTVPDLALVGGLAPGIAQHRQGAGERIHVLGRVPERDLRGLYEGAAGFVFPSLHEGFGIPPLEAMQLSVPVLCARTGAMPEVLGKAPLWFDPRDISSIRQALERFARMSKIERDRRVTAGLSRARSFSWEKNALALARVVASVMRPDLPDFERQVSFKTTDHRTKRAAATMQQSTARWRTPPIGPSDETEPRLS